MFLHGFLNLDICLFRVFLADIVSIASAKLQLEFFKEKFHKLGLFLWYLQDITKLLSHLFTLCFLLCQLSELYKSSWRRHKAM